MPTALLPDRVRLDLYTGPSGEGGPVYGTTLRDVPARMMTGTKTVRTETGVDVVVTATCRIRPGRTIPPMSLVTLGDQCWDVVDVAHARELSRPSHDDLLLDGPRPVAT